MNIANFIDLVRNGQRPVVTFLPGIADKEDYAEAGMRARALQALDANADDVVRIVFDFEEFAAHNQPLEPANYYDKNGVACLTAREAGHYQEQDTMYFCLDEKVSELFVIESQASVELYAAYCAEGSSQTYVQWLEAKVLAKG